MTPAEAQLSLITDLYVQVAALRQHAAMLQAKLDEATKDADPEPDKPAPDAT